MIEIQVITNDGRIITRASHETEAMLCVDRAYQPGDRIVISGGEHLLTQMDQALTPGEAFLPQKTMTWIVPIGEHRLAYAPGTFEAGRHVILARAMEEKEIFARRNVALNPADLRGDTDFYPHCTANVETRNEACFCARNVIDGMRLNTFHGEWPFQSWGIGAREDAWCRLDWVAGHAVLSDGADISFSLSKTGDRQRIPLGRHIVRWMRLERMQKSDDFSAFPALTEWEVFGKDCR